MNVILLDNVENLGSIGDLVKVKAGYGRNFLLPQGKAALATPENMKAIESRRTELEKHAREELADAKKRAEVINGMELVIPANAGSEDKLFGSVGPICRLEYVGDMKKWQFAIYKFSSERYDPEEWFFPGEEFVDGTVEGAMKAGIKAYD